MNKTSLGGNAKILVIDDDPAVRTVFSIELISAGYSVETAENGHQALEKATAVAYDLALVDFRLPDMNGKQVLDALELTTPKMRKVMVTGMSNSSSNLIQAAKNDADAFLTKPVNLDVLLATVQEQLIKQRADHE